MYYKTYQITEVLRIILILCIIGSMILYRKEELTWYNPIYLSFISSILLLKFYHLKKMYDKKRQNDIQFVGYSRGIHYGEVFGTLVIFLMVFVNSNEDMKVFGILILTNIVEIIFPISRWNVLIEENILYRSSILKKRILIKDIIEVADPEDEHLYIKTKNRKIEIKLNEKESINLYNYIKKHLV